MALSKQKKIELISQTTELLDSSKLTVAATYGGTSVADMQDLRRQAKQDGTVVKVIKNRLLKQSLAKTEKMSKLPADSLKGQLVYAFNRDDELASAQVLAKFAKDHPQIEFVAGFDQEGRLLAAEEVKALAALPGKLELRAQLLSVLASPLSGTLSVLGANTRAMVNILDARAKAIN